MHQYSPFFYVWSPGEREEMFGLGILALLKYARLIFGYTNINFKAGAVCDHTNVFTNIFEIAFPLTPMMQCYTHIQRKLSVGQGNGAYSKLLKDKAYRTQAATDIKHLHECLTHKQFQKMSNFVKEAWTEDEETKLVNTFFKSYINDDKFNRWYVGSSSVLGYHPDNNPTESNMRIIKGTRQFCGLVIIGQDTTSMVTTEFPQLIYKSSHDRVGVEKQVQLQHDETVFNFKSKLYADLVNYNKQFRQSLDSYPISETDNSMEYLVNTKQNLSNVITSFDYQTYCDSLEGISQLSFKDRYKFAGTVSNYCKVVGKFDGDKWTYHGTCAQYRRTLYCHHAAVFQYREKLLAFGAEIPQHRSKKPKGKLYNDDPKIVVKKQYDSISSDIWKLNSLLNSNDVVRVGSMRSRLLEIVSTFPNFTEVKEKAMREEKWRSQIKIPKNDLTLRLLSECNKFLEFVNDQVGDESMSEAEDIVEDLYLKLEKIHSSMMEAVTSTLTQN